MAREPERRFGSMAAFAAALAAVDDDDRPTAPRLIHALAVHSLDAPAGVRVTPPTRLGPKVAPADAAMAVRVPVLALAEPVDAGDGAVEEKSSPYRVLGAVAGAIGVAVALVAFVMSREPAPAASLEPTGQRESLATSTVVGRPDTAQVGPASSAPNIAPIVASPGERASPTSAQIAVKVVPASARPSKPTSRKKPAVSPTMAARREVQRKCPVDAPERINVDLRVSPALGKVHVARVHPPDDLRGIAGCIRAKVDALRLPPTAGDERLETLVLELAPPA